MNEYERESGEAEWDTERACRERNRVWVGKGPRHNYDRKRYSQGAGLTGELNGSVRQREEEITNWRDATDIQSFYFTRFPEEMGEKDMWLKFKKWGDVREVFIA